MEKAGRLIVPILKGYSDSPSQKGNKLKKNRKGIKRSRDNGAHVLSQCLTGYSKHPESVETTQAILKTTLKSVPSEN